MRILTAIITWLCAVLTVASVRDFQHVEHFEAYDHQKQISIGLATCSKESPGDSAYWRKEYLSKCSFAATHGFFIDERIHEVCGQYDEMRIRYHCYDRLVDHVFFVNDASFAGRDYEELDAIGVDITLPSSNTKYKIDFTKIEHVSLAIQIEENRDASAFCSGLEGYGWSCQEYMYEKEGLLEGEWDTLPYNEYREINYTALSYCALIDQRELRAKCGEEVFERYLPYDKSDRLAYSLAFNPRRLISNIQSAGPTWKELEAEGWTVGVNSDWPLWGEVPVDDDFEITEEGFEHSKEDGLPRMNSLEEVKEVFDWAIGRICENSFLCN